MATFHSHHPNEQWPKPCSLEIIRGYTLPGIKDYHHLLPSQWTIQPFLDEHPWVNFHVHVCVCWYSWVHLFAIWITGAWLPLLLLLLPSQSHVSCPQTGRLRSLQFAQKYWSAGVIIPALFDFYWHQQLSRGRWRNFPGPPALEVPSARCSAPSSLRLDTRQVPKHWWVPPRRARGDDPDGHESMNRRPPWNVYGIVFSWGSSSFMGYAYATNWRWYEVWKWAPRDDRYWDDPSATRFMPARYEV